MSGSSIAKLTSVSELARQLSIDYVIGNRKYVVDTIAKLRPSSRAAAVAAYLIDYLPDSDRPGILRYLSDGQD